MSVTLHFLGTMKIKLLTFIMEVFITQHEKKSYSLVSSFFFLMITLKQINTENQG